MSAVTLMGKPVMIGLATDEGAREKRNEDRGDAFAVDYGNGRPVQFLVVADGVTSTQGGGQASEIAVRRLRELLQIADDRPLATRMAEAIQQAHQEILAVAVQNPEWKGMSTTLVLAAIANDQLIVMHLGDSRAYLMRGDRAYQLTLDHTWVQEAIDEKRITEQQALTHPNRHVIQRYLGAQRSITVDQRIILPGYEHETPERRMTTEVLPLEAGDAVLLCSDGLYGKLSSPEIAAQVRAAINQPQRAVDQLIKLALQRQEADNITVVLVTTGGEPVPLAAAPGARSRSWVVPAAIGAILALLALGAFLLLARPAAPATTGDAPPVADSMAVAAAPTAMPVAATAPQTPTEAAAVAALVAAPTLAATALLTPATAAASAALLTTPTETRQPTATPLDAQATVSSDPATATSTLAPGDTAPVQPEPTSLAPAAAAAATMSTAADSILPASPPAATPRPGAIRPTSTAVPTRTPVPTSTPMPTATPTSTSSRIPTPSRTPTTALALAAQTSAPEPGTSQDTGPTRVDIKAPEDELNTRDPFTISWVPEQPLAPGQSYEVLFWSAQSDSPIDARSWVGASPNTMISINPEKQTPGDYYWAVYLVTTEPYLRLHPLSQPRKLTIQGQGGGVKNPNEGGGK